MAQPITVEPVTSGQVTIKTTAGDILMELWPKEAPKACRNFIQLALEGYYEGCEFHRVVPGFCVQTGDASNSGEGGESIYEEFYFEDEFSQRLRFNRRGLVAMANTGKRNTNLSQFFITLDRADGLQNKHTIFGTVRGDTYFNVLKISEGELQPDSERPLYPYVIKSITVDDNPFTDIVPRITAEERRAQAKARQEARRLAAARSSKKKKGVKNKSLVSFGDEAAAVAEENEEEGGEKIKIGSAHDRLVNDRMLSREVKDQRGLPPDMPAGFGEGPGAASSSSSSRRDQHPSTSSRKPDGPRPDASTSSHTNGTAKSKESTSQLEAYLSKKKSSVTPAPAESTPKQSESDRVKAEIAKVQADLKKLTKRGHSEHEEEDKSDSKGKRRATETETSSKSKLSGAELLAAEQAKYAKGGRSIGKDKSTGSGGGSSSKRRREDDEDMLSVLEGFRGKVRAAATSTSTGSATVKQQEADREGDGPEANIDGYAGEILEDDDDGDDEGWLAHTLRFRKDATMDQHTINEYEVIDPRAQNMTLEDAKRQEARLRRQGDQKKDGARGASSSSRLGGHAVAQAERDVRNREGGGSYRNRARDGERSRDYDRRRERH